MLVVKDEHIGLTKAYLKSIIFSGETCLAVVGLLTNKYSLLQFMIGAKLNCIGLH